MGQLNFIGTAGTITPPSGLGVVITRIQGDTQNAAADSISIAISGSLSDTAHTFGAIRPIETEIRFQPDEVINISGTDGGTDDSLQVVINYVLYGDNSVGMMRNDLQHSVYPTPWRFRS